MTHLLCLLFGHRYGEWTQTPDVPCTEIRVCQRDGHAERRPAPHHYGEWQYTASDSCEQLATCTRCGHQTRQTAHTLTEWKYVSDHSCEQTAVCSRCGQEQSRLAPHQYQADAYQSYPYQQSGLAQAARCARCGATACSACGGELEPVEMNLDREPPWGVLRTYKCTVCGAQMYTHSTEW
jgi:hypothetical protein